MAATSETPAAHAREPGEAYRRIEVRRFAPALGAEVRGVDLADGIDDDELAAAKGHLSGALSMSA